MKRQITVAARVRPGDVARLDKDGEFRLVQRVTGSPGRKSANQAALVRFFCDGVEGFVAVRSNAAVEIRPRLQS